MSKLPKEKLQTIFPKASKDFIDANAAAPVPPTASGENDELARKKKSAKKKVPRQPNQTEREFGMILEAQRRQGRILRYMFEGIRLKWGIDEETGEAMWYKPDWFVVVAERPSTVKRCAFVWRCVEVKGEKIWDRDIVRFKGCRAAWPEIEFQFWQKKEGLWNQLL